MKLYNILSASLVVLILAGCGSHVARDASTSSASSTSGTQTSATTTSGNIYNLPLASQFVAKINGINGSAPAASSTIAVDHTLKIKVTPLGAPNVTVPGYTNWVFPYGCMRVQVTVNGTTQTTQILKVDGQSQGSTSKCASAPTYQVLDFSNATTGNGTVTVTMSNAEYDNCRYTWPMNYGCSMSAIFQNHIVAADIQMQTDGTWMDP